MRSRTRAAAIAAAALAALPFMSGRASAGTDNWNNSSGGLFSDPTNWSLGNPPGAADDAVIDVPGFPVPYTVNFGPPDSFTSNSLTMDDGASATFAFDPNSVAVSPIYSAGATIIGGTSSAQLTIEGVSQNGYALGSTSATIGDQAGSNGSVTLSDDGNVTNWAISGPLIVGNYGSGTLNVTGYGTAGGGGCNLFIGQQSGSTGTVTVGGGLIGGQATLQVKDVSIGNGSDPSNQDVLTVGASGQLEAGNITINSSGKLVENTGGFLFANSISSGNFAFNGGYLELPSVTLGQDWAAANLTIGNSQQLIVDNTLTIPAGGTLTLNGGTVNTGALAKDPAGSINYVSGSLSAGGDMVIDPEAGATFTSANITVNGGLSQGGNLTVGDGGNASMQLYNGNVNTAGNATIAAQATSTSSVTIGDGVSQPGGWVVGGELTLGQGSASLTINSNGSLQTQGTFNILPGSSLTENGGSFFVPSMSNEGGTVNYVHGLFDIWDDTLTVDPALTSSITASMLTLGATDTIYSRNMIIGNTGNVAVNILGGFVFANGLGGNISVGAQAGSDSSVTVGQDGSGTGGALETDYQLVLGGLATGTTTSIAGGTGTVTINPGGAVYTYMLTMYTGSNVYIDGGLLDAQNFNPQGGIVQFNGGFFEADAGSTVTLGSGGNVPLGLTVNPGDAVSLGVPAQMRDKGITVNGGSFTGASVTRLSISSPQIVFDSGALTLNGPATLGPASDVNAILPENVTLNGGDQLVVNGQTTIDAGATLDVEGGSFTTQTLNNQGTFTFGSGSLSIENENLVVDDGAAPPVRFFGANLTEDNNDSIEFNNVTIGSTGTGTAVVKGTSSLSAGNNLIIGDSASGTGTVTLGTMGGTATTGSLQATQSLIVGNSGNGDLEVVNGSVQADNVMIGAQPGSTGVVNVTNGTLATTNGSVVVGGTNVNSVPTAGGTGTLNIGANGTVAVAGDLSILAGGQVNLNGGTLTTYFFDDSSGSLNFNGGLLSVYSDNLYVGPTHPLGSTLTLNNSDAINVTQQTMIIDSGGTVNMLGATCVLNLSSIAVAGTLNYQEGNLNIYSGQLTIDSQEPVGCAHNLWHYAAVDQYCLAWPLS